MFERFLENTAQLVVKRRLWMPVIAAWVIAAAGMTLFAPSLTEVGVMNEASFLPESSGYLEAKEMFRQKFPDQAAAGQGMLIFHDPNGLSPADREYAATLAGWLASSAAPAEVERVVSVFERPEMEAMLVSQDGQAMLMQVDFSTADYDTPTNEAVQAIRDHVAETVLEGLAVYVSGPAAIGKDMLDAALESVDKTMLVTIVLVVVVLLLIYRSPVASLVPLITIATAFLVSRGILAYLAQAGVEIPAMLDSFTIVLIFGVGTDYALFLISRFREEIGRGNGTTEAVVRTIAKVGPVIAASAAMVIIGTAGMVVGSFKMIKINGPAMGLSIAITLLVSLTLTPALLQLFGRRLFWPHRRRYDRIGEGIINWKKLGHFVTRRPLLTTVVVLVLLLAPFPAWGRMNSTFDILGEIPEEKDSAQGFEALADHFATGDLAPVTVLLTSPRGELLEPEVLGTIADVTTALESVAGVEKVRSVLQPTDDPDINAAFRVDRQLAEMISGLQEMGVAMDDPSQLASPTGNQDPAAGLALLSDYLAELGAKFPGVKDDAHYQGAVATLETLGGYMAAMMDQARLDAQLALMAGQVEELGGTLADPQAMAQADEGTNPSTGLSSLADYMTELGAAFPELQNDDAYTDALSTLDELGPALAALQEQALMSTPEAQAALQQTEETLARLAGDLRALETHFAGQETLFFPASLVGQGEAAAAIGAVKTDLNRLVTKLDALAQGFAGQVVYFIPQTMVEGTPELAELLNLFFARDRTATQLAVLLEDDPYSLAAGDTIDLLQEQLNQALNPGDVQAYVGGVPVMMHDVQRTVDEDFGKVRVVVVAGVFLVFAILLRSLVAPIYLVLSVLLSYGTTMGLSTLLFQDLLGYEGVNYIIPIIIFVLLVALGADYNIFLMARVREETEKAKNVKEGIRLASTYTGGIITSCGIILAGTFAALTVSSITMLVQIGAAIAIGVLIDTFIVRTLLVPAVATLLDRWSWWPGQVES